MSEINPGGGRQTDKWLEAGKTNIQVVYVLYLAGFAFAFTPLIGVVMAHINRDKATGWVATHYTYAIRTFWIGLLYSLVSLVLAILLVGFLLMIATAVWFVVRCVIGLMAASRDEPIRNPDGWLI
jgi:uncharacterized membrane protein